MKIISFLFLISLPIRVYSFASCGTDPAFCDQWNTTASGCIEMKGGLLNPDPNAGVNVGCQTTNPALPFACTTQPLCQAFGTCKSDSDCNIGQCNRTNPNSYRCSPNSVTGWGCCIQGQSSSSSSAPGCMKRCADSEDCSGIDKCCRGCCGIPNGCGCN